jgi:hypothetical protein
VRVQLEDWNMFTSIDRRLGVLAAALALSIGVVSCGGSDDSAPGDTAQTAATNTQTTTSTDDGVGPLPDVGDKRERDKLTAVWARIRSDFRKGRMGAVCARVGGFGMGGFPPGKADPPGGCERKLRWFANHLTQRPPAERLTVGGVRVYEFGIGGITLVDAQGARTRVPFLIEDGQWKIELGVFNRPEMLVAPIENPGPPAAVRTHRPAAAFAPYVRFHPRELWWPLGADDFIDWSIFSWSNPRCAPEEIAIGASRRRFHRHKSVAIVDPRRLAGARAYRHRPQRSSCAGRESRSYTPGQRTSPFGRGSRPPGLELSDGFMLDLATAERAGNVPRGRGNRVSAPAYFQQRAEPVGGDLGVRIEYWMLYGFERPLPEAAGVRAEHEGDWERVSVLLRRLPNGRGYAPVSVRYHVHGEPVEVPWPKAVAFDSGGGSGRATHPGVFAARGTHAPYPAPGSRRVSLGKDEDEAALEAIDQAVGCARCPSWSTWRDLERLSAQLWYGYRGAWGESEDSVQTGVEGPAPTAGR